MKLSVKFFLAFLFTSVLIEVLLIATMQFYAYRNFSEYLRRLEMEKLGALAQVLSDHYREHDGWELLMADPRRWEEIVGYENFDFYMSGPLPPPARAPYPGLSPKVLSEPEPLADGEEGYPRSVKPPLEKDLFSDSRVIRKTHDPLGIAPRVTLFDSRTRRIAGPASSPEGHMLIDITVDGATVGRLGMRERKGLSNPPDVDFIKRQSQAFYTVGAAMLVIAAAVAYLLARHLLSPVGQLMKGTKALTSRHFSERINVSTGDELGQLASDFNQMAQTLERYEEMRKQWLSDISHELRTPLSILQGEIEAVQDGVRELTAQTVSSLHAEVMCLNRIVNDLHELSLAETEILRCRREPVAVLAVVRETLLLFQNRFREHRIAVADRLGGDESFTVAGDRDRLAQLFSNLLENTLKYTDPPGTLELRQTSTDGHLTISLEDTEPGVPEESLERLFDRLYRADPSRNRARGGSGLGLAICKSIVESHGGEIKAANAPAGGLRVEIVFPLIGSS